MAGPSGLARGVPAEQGAPPVAPGDKGLNPQTYSTLLPGRPRKPVLSKAGTELPSSSSKSQGNENQSSVSVSGPGHAGPGSSPPLTCDSVCVQPAPEGEDVQLVQPGDLLQESPAVRAQARVQHRLASAQLEVEDALHRTSAVRGGLGGTHAPQSALGPVVGSPTWHKCFVRLSSTGMRSAFPAVATSNESGELAMTTTSPPMTTKITTGYYRRQERATRTSAEAHTSCFVPTSDHRHKGVSPRMSPASCFF